MLKIGLTGGIGSGKTTVARIFEVLGIPVYYADAAARRLMQEDVVLQQKLRETFGEEIFHGTDFERERLAALVFGNAEKLLLLNSIVHPATLADAEQWLTAQRAPYAVKEAALIFEAGADKMLDLVIGVSAPEDLRIQRAMSRDNLSEEAVRARIARQMNETEKMSRCDFVVVNDGEQMLIPQVHFIHEQLLQNSERVHL